MIRDTTPVFEDVILDSILFHATAEHIRQKKPRLVFVGFGETDEWSHAGRYDLYLDSAHNVDRFIKGLWDEVQQIPQYRDKTTFIISTDHGRGSGLTGWKDHGANVEGAEGIWLAVIGPDTPPLGERSNTSPVTQSQIAGTIAALFGQNFRRASPKAGPPIADLLASGSRTSAAASTDASLPHENHPQLAQTIR
jgi:hypothetical protein